MTATAPKPAETEAETKPAFTVEQLVRHEPDSDGKGRAFYSAVVVADDGMLGVDNIWGSWTIFESSYDRQLTVTPGDRTVIRREVMPVLAKALAAHLAENTAADDSEPAQSSRSRRRR